ncbi:uncharacterized protein [Anabrus simplex]|uniref:uncharacterized protein n=1 Tax=Anabrus simplex TaxID=316456 RepID=UPI0035A3A12D
MSLLKLSLLLCIGVSALYAQQWDDIVVKWDPLGVVSNIFNTAFFSLPTTSKAALSQNWVEVESDSEYWSIWCLPDDPRVCVLYDQQGNFAGIDVGLPPEDYSGAPYDLSQHPMYSNVTRFNQIISKGRIFLVSQDVLKSGGRSDLSEGVGTGLWLQNGDSLMEVPTTVSEIEEKTLFTRQSCVPGMGRHYYYNMTKQLDCRWFEPYFLITDVHTGSVHGIGFQGFGHPSHKGRVWFENVPAIAIRPTIPETPDCLVDWAQEYNVISLHIYFRSKPWNIGCGGILDTGFLA